jgi:uncharacterized protein GlcG (DUF336 family)
MIKAPSRGRFAPAALALLLLAGCGGSSNDTPLQLPNPSQASLTATDVQQVIAQAVGEAQARNTDATIAVVDRVGNVLGVFATTKAPATFTIDGGRGATGGLEGISVLPSELAVISKAITAAYFSSAGNAFTTRTAGQVLQEHFDPGEANQPAGPLFGVQFSQLTCSDVSKQASAGSIGPKRTPLGFAAAPGGLPLYKGGAVVGAIGVLSHPSCQGTGCAATAPPRYSVVTDYINDTAPDPDELIAVAGTAGFAAPTAIRADHITADGRVLRFTNSEALMSDPTKASFAAINGVQGSLVDVPGYGGNPVVDGTAYGTPASGIRAVDTTDLDFGGTDAYILVDAVNNNRYPPKAGTDGFLTRPEVVQLLKSSLQVANQARAQVRQPVGSTAQVSIVVVDTNGVIVGYIRSPDALVDSVDVVAQKARTAAFFSNKGAAAALAALPPANYLVNGSIVNGSSPITAYVMAAQQFFGDTTVFANGIAFSTRSVTGISTPLYPDGLDGTPSGPFSKPYFPLSSTNTDIWSIFNTGLELDLVYNKLLASLTVNDLSAGCTGIPSLPNGITVFGGGFPIYRTSQNAPPQLVGAIGVSGDGTQQSDLIAFVGVDQAGKALNTGIGNAPASIRADTLSPQGSRLRYASCPVAPFNNSTVQDACVGL